MPCFRGPWPWQQVIHVCHDNFFHQERLFFIPGPSFFKASFFYELATVTSILCTDADICPFVFVWYITTMMK